MTSAGRHPARAEGSRCNDPDGEKAHPERPSVRAYARDGRTFAGRAEGLTDQAGGLWRLNEEALKGPEGQLLDRVAGQVSYYFAWDGYLGEAGELYRP